MRTIRGTRRQTAQYSASLLCTATLLLASLSTQLPVVAQAPTQNTTASSPPKWSATGQLFESCTCAVPCTCNFGQGPSPNHYCYALFLYKLDSASWNGIDLSGLYVGGADGPDGRAGMIDDRATVEQKSALESLGRALFAKGGPSRGKRIFVPTHLSGTLSGNELQVSMTGHGSFTASILMGKDRKSPIIVQNNTVWPIPKAIKAKASALNCEDKVVGSFKASNNNANYGDFQLSSDPPPASTGEPAVK